jgi:hypothetical protein
MVKIGKAAYHLNLPEGSLVHLVFYISQLKPFTLNDTPVFSNLTASVDLSAHELQPEAVLDRHILKKGDHAVPQLLMK